jgi:hypothetical protein
MLTSVHFMNLSVLTYLRQYWQEGCEAGTNYWGPAPDCVAYVFVFLGSIVVRQLYKLTLSDQTQVTLQLTVSLSNSV